MDRVYPSEFYGDTTRWFVGVVEDISDPLRLSRVRVRVHGLHTSVQDVIQTSDLPWAQVVLPTTEAGTSGIGRAGGLQPGAMVFGMFLDGKNSQLPIVLGSLPRIEGLSPVQGQSTSSDEREIPSTEPTSTAPGTGTTGQRNNPSPVSEKAFGLEGNTNPEIAFNYFLAYGFEPHQAAGIVGNLMQESGPSLKHRS